MTKDEFLQLMQFPEGWNSSGMYPDELFQGQISGYRVGDENAAEHDRNGAFHWWLKRNPTRAQLEQLLKLAILDPDPLMGADVRSHIRAAVAFDAGLSKLEADLLSASRSLD